MDCGFLSDLNLLLVSLSFDLLLSPSSSSSSLYRLLDVVVVVGSASRFSTLEASGPAFTVSDFSSTRSLLVVVDEDA